MKPQIMVPFRVLSPQATGTDHFGYSWDDSYTTNSWTGAWTDTTNGGTRLFFGTEQDDDLIAAVNLPFTFKFYEKSYNQIQISTNGLLGFDTSVIADRASYKNLSIPHDAPPQNFIAPFWSDLTFVSIYYKGGADDHGDFFAVEWHQCQHYDEPNVLLTFEVKLYKNGDILFLYDQLQNTPKQKSIGVEDADNVNGLVYLVNSPGPNEGQAILISYPSEARRVKIFPRRQSSFSIARNSTFQVKVRNTGDKNPDPKDTFNLQTQISDPDWTVMLYAANGYTPLINHDSDPLPDTGEILPGETFTVTVRVSAPLGVDPGETVTVTLTASSSKNAAAQDQAIMVSAVPAAFAHTYRNASQGIPGGVHIDLINPAFRLDTLVNPNYTGASFCLSHTTDNSFLGIWENNISGIATNLSYMSIDRIGNESFSVIRNLTSNTDQQDRWPVSATAPDGKIGVAWIRTVPDMVTSTYRQNIYFAILDDQAQAILVSPFSITSDDNSYPFSQVSVYRDLQIAVTNDNYFHLSWIQWHSTGAVSTEDIAHTVYDTSGMVIKAPELITSQTQGVDYSGPSLIPFLLNDNDLILELSFQRTNPNNPTYKIISIVMNSSGAIVSPQSVFYSQNGAGLDGIQMTNGKLAVAWVNLETERINYAVLENNLEKPAQPNELKNPDEFFGPRTAGRVSVARANKDRAVLTWMDESFKHRLYYALLVDNGSSGLITPPLILRSILPGQELSLETRGAFGSAEYLYMWRLLMPIIRR